MERRSHPGEAGAGPGQRAQLGVGGRRPVFLGGGWPRCRVEQCAQLARAGADSSRNHVLAGKSAASSKQAREISARDDRHGCVAGEKISGWP